MIHVLDYRYKFFHRFSREQDPHFEISVFCQSYSGTSKYERGKMLKQVPKTIIQDQTSVKMATFLICHQRLCVNKVNER